MNESTLPEGLEQALARMVQKAVATELQRQRPADVKAVLSLLVTMLRESASARWGSHAESGAAEAEEHWASVIDNMLRGNTPTAFASQPPANNVSKALELARQGVHFGSGAVDMQKIVALLEEVKA
jgi:hypothetical protein